MLIHLIYFRSAMDEFGYRIPQPIKYGNKPDASHRFLSQRISSKKSAFYEKLMFFETGQRLGLKNDRAIQLPARTTSTKPSVTDRLRRGYTDSTSLVSNRCSGFSYKGLHKESTSNFDTRTLLNSSQASSEFKYKRADPGYPPSKVHRNVSAHTNTHIAGKRAVREEICFPNTNVISRNILSGLAHEETSTTNRCLDNRGTFTILSDSEHDLAVDGNGTQLSDMSMSDRLSGNSSWFGSSTASLASPLDASNIREDTNLYRLGASQYSSAPNLLSYRDGIGDDVSSHYHESVCSLDLTFTMSTNKWIDSSRAMLLHCNKGYLDRSSNSSDLNQPPQNTPSGSQSIKNATDVPYSHQDNSEKIRSTANICLMRSESTSSRDDENKNRKIRVIKSAGSFRRGIRRSNTKNRSSPRLDEWLRSVMKVQKEMASQNTDCWPFPEDESVDSSGETERYLEPPVHLNEDALEPYSEYRRLSSPLPCKSMTEYDIDFVYMKRPRSSPVPETSERDTLFEDAIQDFNKEYIWESHVKQQSHAIEPSSVQHSDIGIKENQEKCQEAKECALTDPLSPGPRSFHAVYQPDLCNVHQRWSTTGINTDISLPVADKSGLALCRFCTNCRSTGGALECASARFHGVCCACRHVADQVYHSTGTKSSCGHSIYPKTVPKRRINESVQTSPELTCTCADDETTTRSNSMNHETQTKRSSFIKGGDGSSATEASNTNLGSELSSKTVQSSKEFAVCGASHPAVGITIRVTGEEERDIEEHHRRTPSAFRAVKDTHRFAASFANKRPDTSPTGGGSHSPLTRGTSPHYVFPSSANPCDEELLLRNPMSPRNSVGSISSIHSYKSSNADSAVDLGPPDDEHDHDPDHDDQEFAFDEFLAKHQDKHAPGIYQSPESASYVPCLNIFPCVPSLPSVAAAACPDVPLKQQSSALPFAKYSPSLSSLPNSSSSTPVPDYDLVKEENPEQPLRTHAIDTSGSNPNSGSLRKDSDGLGKDKPTDPIPDNKERGTASQLERQMPSGPQTLQYYQQKQQHLFLTATSTSVSSQVQMPHIPVDEKRHFKPLRLELSVPSEYDLSLQQSGQRDHRRHIENPSSHSQLPELVISDHSSDPTVIGFLSDGMQSPHPLNPSLEDASLSSDNESSVTSHPPSPNLSVSSGSFTPTFGDLLQVQDHMRIRRTSSASSISSEGSTCSTCSYVSDTGKRPTKVSTRSKSHYGPNN